MKTMALRFGLVFAVGFAIAARAAEQNPEALAGSSLQTLLSEANMFFNDANQRAAADPEAAKDLYQKAILRFERIAQQGGVRNGRLYYNLANAYFLSGDIGRAILDYRRATQYIPNDVNLHQNLDWARSQRIDRIDEPQRARVLKTLFFWHYDLSMRARTWIFAAAFLALWALAALRLFTPRRWLVAAIMAFAALSLLFFGSLAVDAWAQSHDASGVVLAQEVVGRKGNGESYEASFKEPLHAGTEFSLLEARSEWWRIALLDGRDCWIPAAAAETVQSR
jgi:hypothetical protein